MIDLIIGIFDFVIIPLKNADNSLISAGLSILFVRFLIDVVREFFTLWSNR